jgi:hypothetical protein
MTGYPDLEVNFWPTSGLYYSPRSLMHLRNLHLLAIALITISLSCCAQTGTVTFYSIQPSLGHQLADEVIPSGKAPFVGLLYDGNQRLAHATGGRFMTFLFPVGDHQFSASYRHLSPGDPSAHLNIEAGGLYCVRLSATYKSGSIVLPLAVFHGVIEQVPCDKASKEAGTYKPLQLKRIDSAVRTELVSSQAFPKQD